MTTTITTKPWTKAEVIRQFKAGTKMTLVHRSKAVGTMADGDCKLHREVRFVDSSGIAMYAPEVDRLSHIALPTKENGIQFIPTDDGFLYVTKYTGTLTYRWEKV